MTTRYRINTFSPKDRLLIADATMEGGDSFPLHQHDFSELAIVLRGTGTHIVEADSFSIRAGDVFVIHGNTTHGFSDAKNLTLCNIMYDPSRYPGFAAGDSGLPGYHALFQLEPYYQKLGRFESRLHLSPLDMNRLSGTLDALRTEFSNMQAGYSALLGAHFTQLAVFLARSYGARVDSEDSRIWRLASAIAHMDERFRESLSIDDLAERAQLSTSHFCREFRSVMGVPPIDYILRKRVAEACNLMGDSQLSVTEIAFTVGFSDGNYFSRQFRRVMGRSPRDYRKGLRQS